MLESCKKRSDAGNVHDQWCAKGPIIKMQKQKRWPKNETKNLLSLSVARAVRIARADSHGTR